MRPGVAPTSIRWLFVPAIVFTASWGGASPNGDIDDTDWHVDLSGFRRSLPQVEVARTCPGQRMSCGEVVFRAAISLRDERHQYRFEATEGQLLTLGTDDAEAFHPVDTVLDLLADDCSTVLASDDDGGPGSYSLIHQFVAPYTGSYIAQVRGFDPKARGTYSLYLICEEAPLPPADDDCGGELRSIACGSGTLSGDTSAYRDDYDPGDLAVSCTGRAADGRDVVIALDLLEGDTVELAYRSSVDGALYVLSDCTASWSCEIGADESGVGEEERLPTWVAPKTKRYFLVLDSNGSNTGGSWKLVYEINCRAPAGACCLDDGRCLLTTGPGCDEAGGNYFSGEESCVPDPCAPLPVLQSSWGGLKVRFRDEDDRADTDR